jgi:hypothetical protein
MNLVQKIILTVLGLSFWCVILTLIGLALGKFLRLRNTRQHTLRLANQGNVPVVYQLLVETAAQGLGFILRQGKQKLEDIAVPAAQIPVPPEAAQVELSMQVDESSSVDEVPNPKRSGKPLAGFSRSISTGLGHLGRLLPGDAGRFFREQQAALNRVKSVAVRGAQTQSSAQRKLAPPPKISRRRDDPNAEGSSLRLAPSPALLRPVYQAKTPLVHPGETLEVNLLVTSKTRRNLTQRYTYVVRSLTLPQEEFKQVPAVLSKSGVVVFPQLSAWHHQSPVWISLLVALVSLALLGFFLSWLW